MAKRTERARAGGEGGLSGWVRESHGAWGERLGSGRGIVGGPRATEWLKR